MFPEIAAFLRALESERRAPKTIAWYRDRLHHYATHIEGDWSDTQTVRSYLSGLTSSPATVHASYRALRAFFKFCLSEGLITSSPIDRIKPPKVDNRTPKAVDLTDYVRLIRAAVKDSDARMLAILLLLGDTGMRAGELCGLKPADLRLDQSLVKLNGKGRKQRWVSLSAPTVEAVRAWMALSSGPWLFPGEAGPLHVSSLRALIARFARGHGIAGVVNPHAFRHLFALAWLNSGGDISSLADFLGHDDLSTTRQYLRFQTEQLRAKHAKHSPLTSLDLGK